MPSVKMNLENSNRISAYLVGSIIGDDLSGFDLDMMMSEFTQTDKNYIERPMNGLKTVVFYLFKAFDFHPLLLLVIFGKAIFYNF